MQQVALIGKNMKEQAKERAKREQQTLSGVAYLGLKSFVGGGLGEFVEDCGPFPLAADRLLFVVNDDDLVEEARAKLPEGESMASLYRTIFYKYLRGELTLTLA